MNNPEPIARHESLVPFSRDHHFGLLLVWKIRQGISNKVIPLRISNYVLYFYEQDLQAHFLDEERHIFSLLDAKDPLRVQAEQEHENIRKLIRDIADDKNNAELLQRFAENLKNHIRFEERSLFNHIQTSVALSQQTLEFEEDRIGRTETELAWHDAFWEKEKNEVEAGEIMGN